MIAAMATSTSFIIMAFMVVVMIVDGWNDGCNDGYNHFAIIKW